MYTYTYIIVFICEEKWKHIICRIMDGARDLHVKQNEQVSERQIPHVLYNMHNLGLVHECVRGTFWGGNHWER
jgi:uncharacterized protein with PIN domain